MKKFVSLLLALILVVSLAACGSAGGQDAPEQNAPEQNASEQNAPEQNDPVTLTVW